MANFHSVDMLLTRYCSEGIIPSAALCVYHKTQKVHQAAYGVPDPLNKTPADVSTRYDIASLTKIFVTTAFMTLVEDGLFSVDEKVSGSFPSFTGPRGIVPDDKTAGMNSGYCDAGEVSWRHILTHTSGMKGLEMYTFQKAEDAFDEILRMPFAQKTGSSVLYADVGFILLGRAMELRAGLPLDELVKRRVCNPLGLNDTGYIRLSLGNPREENIAPTEFCKLRNRQIHGQAHDENAWFMDGVAGHAGLFSTANDAAALCQDYLNSYNGKEGLLTTRIVREMTRVHDERTWNRRGLGWQLRIHDPDNHSYPLSDTAFGHTGFTGTCMWVDPERDMCFALFTNEVYYGRKNRRFLDERIHAVSELTRALDAV